MLAYIFLERNSSSAFSMPRIPSKSQSLKSHTATFIPLPIDFPSRMASWIGAWYVTHPQILNGVFIHIDQGTTDKNAFCETCGQSYVNCVGHYAYIKLVVPVFHIGYFKHTIAILQAICKVREPPPTSFLHLISIPDLCKSPLRRARQEDFHQEVSATES